VQNAVDYLSGERDARLHEVTLSLGAELLALSRLAPDVAAGRTALERALASGAAAERFERMVAALGGPNDFLRRARALLPAAPIVRPVAPRRAGFVEAIDARAVGLAVVELGGGRARATDAIDPAVGLTRLAGLGAEVSTEAPLALVHAPDEGRAEAAMARLRAAYRIGDAAPALAPPVVARIVGTRI
jgi:thymidine phosphorylase